MAKKKAIIGFKGVALAKVTKDTITEYEAEEAKAIPYAGSMTRTAKETTQDVFYDDALYSKISEHAGDDVEIRFGEMELELIGSLGLGAYDKETGTLEADFTPKGDTYALRCVADTVDHLPLYFNWRAFDLTGLRFDNFATKGSSIQVCEVIMTGVLRKPRLASAKPYAIRTPKEDGSDLAACDAWLAAAETLPKAGA